MGLPCYSVIIEAKKHEIQVARPVAFPSGSVVVVDRGYVDYARLYNLDSCGVTFVTRLRSNADIAEVDSILTDSKRKHILSDEDILLAGYSRKKSYPKPLRVVKVQDPVNDQTLYLLTNQMSWTADTISQLYKARWDVEVFFKHLKQLFRVNTFGGTSANAVRVQMWCSMIAILLVNCLKRRAKDPWHLSNLIIFLRINLFVKIDLWKWLDKPLIDKNNSPPQQLIFG